jgi:hypothetical protein
LDLSMISGRASQLRGIEPKDVSPSLLPRVHVSVWGPVTPVSYLRMTILRFPLALQLAEHAVHARATKAPAYALHQMATGATVPPEQFTIAQIPTTFRV